MTNTDKNNFNATIGNTVLCDGFLIQMTDFVNNVSNMENYPSHEKALSWIYNYATFLKKPLKLGYFIPCDENDVPLEEPSNLDRMTAYWADYPINETFYKVKKYDEAKQRVLFEGFEYDKENDWVTYNEFARFFVSELQNGKVEDLHELITEKVKLTKTAKKEIGYETT